MTEVKSLRRQLGGWRTRLVEKKGARDQLIRTKESETAEGERLKAEQSKYRQAHAFMMSELTDRRSKALASIEGIGTTGLRMLYGPDYELRFETFDEKRSEEGIASYKMEMRVASMLDGEVRSFIINGGKGGGVLDALSVIMRDAGASWLRYHGFIMLDEVCKYLSKDQKVYNMAGLMRQMADLTGRQYLFSTHLADVFAPVADNIIRLTNKDGIVCAERVDPSELADIEEEYGEQEQDD